VIVDTYKEIIRSISQENIWHDWDKFNSKLSAKILVILLNENVLDSEMYEVKLLNQIIEKWMNNNSCDYCKKVISRT
jgi:hypothetical protein